MESGNAFFDLRETRASPALNVLIAYENLADGQRAVRLCWDLACQQEEGLSLRPRLWRLDLIADSVCSGYATDDAVAADLLIISISCRAQLSDAAQQWLRFCFARKRGTSAALIALLRTADQINAAYALNLQFLRGLAQEADLEFFAPFADLDASPDNVRSKAELKGSARLAEVAGPVGRQMAQAHRPAMIRAVRDTNYRDWGIND